MMHPPTSAGRFVRAAILLMLVVLLAAALAGCSSGSGSSAAAGVQQLNVDVSSGNYVPNELNATAGTPIQITFSQGPGCATRIVFPELNLKADSSQGPATLDLGVLQPGDYPWACSMNMYHGVLHVK